MNETTVKRIIALVLDNANDAIQEYKENNNSEFYDGKKLAYYEVLDTIKNQLIIEDQDLKEFGLDIDLDKMI